MCLILARGMGVSFGAERPWREGPKVTPLGYGGHWSPRNWRVIVKTMTAPTNDTEDLRTAAVETHISRVFFDGDRVLKTYKPVTTDVLELTSLESRARMCDVEIEVNRRFAPDVYLGRADVVVGGEPIEHMVVMRRMPASRRLSTLLNTSERADAVRAVARAVAAIHAGLEPLAPEDARLVASQSGLTERFTADVEGFADSAAGVVPDLDPDDLRRLAVSYISGRGPLLEHRIESGSVIDGHGDLLADDIFVLEDGPRILDALAFDDHLRWGDVLADIAFLVMDLQHKSHRDLARAFLYWYCEFSGEHHPGSLAHFYVAQRALVRAKVTALRAQQSYDEDLVAEARQLASLCVDHLERAQVRLMLVGGLPGSGKSTVASGVAEQLGWTVVGTDEVRRDQLTEPEPTRIDEGRYSPEAVRDVYQRCVDRARFLLERGESVVVDATWTSEEMREMARDAADQASAGLIEVRCEAPVELCRERVASRSDAGLSEATPEVVNVISDRFDRWPGARRVSTSKTAAEAIQSAVQAIPVRPWPPMIAVSWEPVLASAAAFLRASRRRR